MNRELLNRILFSLWAVFVYRLGSFVFIPGVNVQVVSNLFAGNQGGLLSFINSFSGGMLSKMSIFSLGIIPMISASMFVQMLSSSIGVEFFIRLKKQGGAARAEMEKYTHWLSFVFAFSQAFIACAVLMVKIGSTPNAFYINRWLFLLISVTTLMSGSMFMIWLSSQVSKKGVGSGSSFFIYMGVISNIASSLHKMFKQDNMAFTSRKAILIVGLLISIVIFIIMYIENTNRIVQIQYSEQVVKSRAQNHPMPLKINMVGIMPAMMSNMILSSFQSIIYLLSSFLAYFAITETLMLKISNMMSTGNVLYSMVFGVLLVSCTFLYTTVICDPSDIADNLQKGNGIVPGYSPGKKTVDFFKQVLDRLVYFAAVYLCLVCVIPGLLSYLFNLSFQISGTSALILVTSSLEIWSAMKSMLKETYEDKFIANKIYF